MQIFKQYSNHVLISMLFILTVLASGCGSSSDTTVTQNTATPTVLSTATLNGDNNVTLYTNITAPL